MKKILLYTIPVLMFLSACGKLEKQGLINYKISYQLPDSLARFAAYLPKEAKVYFKGDSAVSVQKSGDESTIVITNIAGSFMRVLLKSSAKAYVVDYNKTDQAEEASLLPKYTYRKTQLLKTITGYRATKYILVDKTTGDSTEAWFTKDVSVTPNFVTMMFDRSLGVPLIFTVNQNGIVSRTSVKTIKLNAVPAGIFSTPAGYTHLTPQQLKELPVDH